MISHLFLRTVVCSSLDIFRQEAQKLSADAYPRAEVSLNWFSDRPIAVNLQIQPAELHLTSISATSSCLLPGAATPLCQFALSNTGKENNACVRLMMRLERKSENSFWDKFLPSAIGVAFAWVAPWVPYNYEEVATFLLSIFRKKDSFRSA